MTKKKLTSSGSDEGKVILDDDYKSTLVELKSRIAEAQVRAIISVNKELVLLYWHIGDSLQKKQQNSAWGSKIIDKISMDIKESFPDMDGFSSRNIRFMIQFAREYRDVEIVKQLVSQIPWGHNIILLQKVANQDERLWYAQQTIENGWSRSMLETWIKSDLYRGQLRIRIISMLSYRDSVCVNFTRILSFFLKGIGRGIVQRDCRLLQIL